MNLSQLPTVTGMGLGTGELSRLILTITELASCLTGLVVFEIWTAQLKHSLLQCQVRKGDTIGEFLRAVQQQLAPEFREVRTTSVENLLYVKEDLIIPHVCKLSFFSLKLHSFV